MELLDPKLDVVFKLLFAAPNNRHLLTSLLTAVLQPPSPIKSVTVLNPELPKDWASDRGVRLDVLVELHDGTRVDVEMECEPRRSKGSRWLYHWARLFGGTLKRGDDYAKLESVVCIVFLDAQTEASRFHAHYRVREEHDHSLLSEALSIHVIELPRVTQAMAEHESADLERWARFLRLEDPRELDSLASESPIMAQAKDALEILSLEPSAQRLAEVRREAEFARRLDRAEDRAEGRAEGRTEGRTEGRAEGRTEGLQSAIVRLCESFGIELDDQRRVHLANADEVALRALFDALLATRAWPGNLPLRQRPLTQP